MTTPHFDARRSDRDGPTDDRAAGADGWRTDEPAARLSRRTLLGAAGVGLAGAGVAGSSLAATASAADGAAGTVGINLGSLEGRGGTFVDAAATHRPIDAQTDADGWPTEDFDVVVFDQRPTAAWAGEIDDPEAYVPELGGTYSVSFSGRADVAPNLAGAEVANQTYDADSNTTTLDLSQPTRAEAGIDSALLILSFSNTRRSDDRETDTGITDLEIVRPGYSRDASQTFTDEWLSLVEPFPVHRYMDWLETNDWAPFDEDGPIWTRWADRTTPADATQKRDPGGVAWEHVVEHANATGADPWINVPVAATDEYVRQLAELLHSDLDDGLELFVEYSNEVWNPGFMQHAWNQRMAVRQTDDGANLGYDGTSDEATLANRRAFQRCVEIGRIFGDVFGSDALGDRLKVLYPWNPIHGPDAARDALQYVADNYGDPAGFGWGLIRTAYFDYDDPSASHDVQQVLDQLASNVPEYDDGWRAVAEDWGLEYVVYEGGPNTSPGLEGDTTNVADRIRAARSDRMGELLQQNATAFLDAGGDLYVHFTVQSQYSRYGTWGATDDVTKPDRNAKYPALLDLVDASDPGDDVRESDCDEVDGQTVCDVDGDGHYRDVTGDGTVGQTDVVEFFERQHRQAWKRPELFDFSGNGDVGHGDVVALFEHVATS